MKSFLTDEEREHFQKQYDEEREHFQKQILLHLVDHQRANVVDLILPFK